MTYIAGVPISINDCIPEILIAMYFLLTPMKSQLNFAAKIYQELLEQSLGPQQHRHILPNHDVLAIIYQGC